MTITSNDARELFARPGTEKCSSTVEGESEPKP
jgi:hypothetical protein